MYSKLILLRHGQSEWNKRNLFTGWVDVPLSIEGVQEAIQAGKKLTDTRIDVIFVSSLIRAQMTAMLVMAYHGGGKVPVIQHLQGGRLEEWSKIYSLKALARIIPVYIADQLNERMYGSLQGLNKKEVMDQYGENQVQEWRRSYHTSPPGGESLKDTADRAIPFFKNQIVPYLEEGKNVFISAHGNSLRSILLFLDDLTELEVAQLELSTGQPILYEFKNGTFKRGKDV